MIAALQMANQEKMAENDESVKQNAFVIFL